MGAKGFPDGASGKGLACQCRRCKRRGFHPWVGRSHGEGQGNPLQYSCLENPLNRGTWGCKEADTTEASVYLYPRKSREVQQMRGLLSRVWQAEESEKSSSRCKKYCVQSLISTKEQRGMNQKDEAGIL